MAHYSSQCHWHDQRGVGKTKDPGAFFVCLLVCFVFNLIMGDHAAAVSDSYGGTGK